MLHIRKQELLLYLRQNNILWRDDGSNQSNKYLRNRIRNELIPLLNDMLENNNTVTNVLERRLDNLQQQATDIRNDLDLRVQTFLTNNVKNGKFLLPSSTDNIMPDAGTKREQSYGIVTKEALYIWIKSQIDGHQLSYEQMQRIYSKLINHPKQQIWQLNIGNSYKIVRYGRSLSVTCDEITNSLDVINEVTRICSTTQSTSVANDEGCKHKWIDIQTDRMGTGGLPYQFIQTTIGVYEQVVHDTFNKSGPSKLLPFNPPWKKSDSSSTGGINKPIGMNAFLRGQNVPLHERPNVPIILRVLFDDCNSSICSSNNQAKALSILSRSNSTTVVAVYISTKQKWIVNQQFFISQNNDKYNCFDQQYSKLYVSTYNTSITS
jgi:hypothetical protein